MGRFKKAVLKEEGPGRPRKKPLLQAEILSEITLVYRDLESGFYGKGDDVDVNAVVEDLEHIIKYARDLVAGAPFYPATGDEYMLAMWEDDMSAHEERMKKDIAKAFYGRGYDAN
jgi:hypothetical protein